MDIKIAIDGRLIGKRGVGRYQANLVRQLLALPGKEQYVLFVARDSFESAVSLFSSFQRDSRLEIIKLSGRNYAWTEQVEIPWRAIRMGCGLIHFTDNTASLAGGLPVVLTLHDTMFLRPLKEIFVRPTFKGRLAYVYRRLIIPRAASRAATVITVSEDSRRCIKAAGLAFEEKITVTREGGGEISLSAVGEVAKVRKKYSLPREFIIAAAAEDKRKNLAGILEAYGLLAVEKRPALAIFGLGAAAARQQWRQEFPRGVIFLGYVPDSDLSALFAGARCLLFPSLGEGFGLPALEAMAYDLPIVAGFCGALEELCGEAALFVDPGVPAEIAGAARKILDEKKTRERLVAAGRTRAKAFSWRSTAEKTLAVYRRVLSVQLVSGI